MRIGELRLEKPTPDDVDPLHRIYSDPRVWTHLPSGRHTALKQTEDMVRAWEEAWDRDGLSAWIVRDITTGELLGHAGCSVKHGAFWNLGYRLAHGTHGRGIATRVSQYAVEQAHRTRPDLPVVAYLLEHNLPSARVAQKVGLSLQHRGPDAGNPDPSAVRLVYADRPLTETQLHTTLL